MDTYGNESPVSQWASAVAPLFLQLQTINDQNGRPYRLEINTYSVVSGSWEMDCSTDLQNWTPLPNGAAAAAEKGDGYDVDVYTSIDPTAPQMFFRVIQTSAVPPLPNPLVLQTQTYTDGYGQLHLVVNTSSTVSGYWELDGSTDLQNWTSYTTSFDNYYSVDYNIYCYDVDVDVPIDPTSPPMFFRVVQ